MYRFPSAVHLLLVQSGQVLLQRRFNTGYEDGNYSVIAGHLEGGETVIEAMIREAKEEADISLDPGDLDIVGVMHRKSDDERIDFFVTASDYVGEIKILEPHKCDDMSWFPLDNLPENIIPYVRRAIQNLGHNSWIDSFGFSVQSG